MSSGRERLYSWDDKSMQWYINAVEYESFHKNVADMVFGVMPADSKVCDVGCGIGALTLKLAPKCGVVTAIDLNPKPLEYLRKESMSRGYKNVEVLCGDFDVMDTPEVKYDAVIFCLAGGVTEFLDKGFNWSDKLFFVENATDKRSFSSVGQRSKEVYYNSDIEYLKSIGADFKYEFFSAPFGQVFTDEADAEAFMRHYDKGESEEDIKRFLSANLEKLDHPKYSLYMPNIKPLVMIEINR